MRRLWIQRINAALSNMEGRPKYSKLINAMKVKNIIIDRKILADLAATDLKTFESIVTFSNTK